jgi:hypothetical protein
MFTLRYNKPIRREILKNGKSRLHVMFYYYSACLHLGKTKENVRTVGVIYVLGFINTGYFTSDNVPDGIKNATHNTFRISSFFRKWLNTSKRLFFNMYSYLMHEQKLLTSVSFSMFVITFLRHALTSQI